MKTCPIVAVMALALAGNAVAGPYDFFGNIKYPAVRRSDVSVDKVEQEAPDDVGYNRRVVHWWPKKGIDVVDIPEGAPLRTWTVRTPEQAPLIEAGYFAKWWPADLRGLKQFDAHLIGFRGIGSRVGDPFGDKAKELALGKGICPSVVLRLADGRKRCFPRGSFSDQDQEYIIDLYDREMDRIRKTLEPPPEGRKESVMNMRIARLNEPGMFREESERFVIVAGSEEPDDGIPSSWVNTGNPEAAALFRKATLRCFEDFWTYLEYAGHRMPYWDRDVRYRYVVDYGGTKRNGLEIKGRGNGGGFGTCQTACWEGLYHEWGHGCPGPGSLGHGETKCDTLQTMADPTLVRKMMLGISRSFKNPHWGWYPGGFGYTTMSDDPNWGYAAVGSFVCLKGVEDDTPMHIVAHLGQERGLWKHGIKGLGDFMGQMGARFAEYDFELESMIREAYPAPNRTYLVALDRSKGLYRSTRVEAPEPFGSNLILLKAEPGAAKITVDFRGLYDPDTFSDWRACIVAVGADQRPRYSPLWNKGEMSMETRAGDKRYWLTVTATPYALARRTGETMRLVYEKDFTYKYPYEIQLGGCRPANPNAPVGVNQNMELIGPALISRNAVDTTKTCGRGDWPHPSDTPEYEEMKRVLEEAAKKAPVMLERLTQPGLFGDSPFCPILGNNSEVHARAVASAVFLEWRAKWLLENAQGGRHPNGGGWVAKSATVAPTAYVGPDCMVLDGAKVLDHAIIEEFAMVSGPGVLIKDNARVYGKAVVCGDVVLSGYARVCRTIFNRESTFQLGKADPGAPPYTFLMGTGSGVTRDGPEERELVYKNAGFKLQANYAFERPETVLLEDFYQEHGWDGEEFKIERIFYDGVLYGGPGFENDGNTRAFTFDGKSQYAEAEGSVVDLGVITVDVRLRAAIGKQQTVFDFGSSTGNRFMLTLLSSGNPAVVATRNGKSTTITSSRKLEDGMWTSCRLEMDGRYIRLWLNNEKVAEKASSFRAADAFPAGGEKRNFIAATRDRTEFFKGSLDHVRVYYTVYDDFAKAPEPPMVSARRIDPEFIRRFRAAYAGYAKLEARAKSAVAKSEISRFYRDLNEEITRRIEELCSSEELTRLQAELQELEQGFTLRQRELTEEFNQRPEIVEKNRLSNELREKYNARFRELRDANAEMAALNEKERASGDLRNTIMRAAESALEKEIETLRVRRKDLEKQRENRINEIRDGDTLLVENRAKREVLATELKTIDRKENTKRYEELRGQVERLEEPFNERLRELTRNDDVLKDLNGQIDANRNEERSIITDKASEDPRYEFALKEDSRIQNRKRQIENGLRDDETLRTWEAETRRLDTGRARYDSVANDTFDDLLKVNRLKKRVEKLRVENALANSPDEYMALNAFKWRMDQYDGAIMQRTLHEYLPPLPEDLKTLEGSAELQQAIWHRRVDWDGRTEFEVSDEEPKPIIKRWLARMRTPGASADHRGEQK